MSNSLQAKIDMAIALALIVSMIGAIGAWQILPRIAVAQSDVPRTINLDATISAWMTFTVASATASFLPPLVDGTGTPDIGTAGPVTLNIGTNAAGGYTVNVRSLGRLARSGEPAAQINSGTATVAAGTDGYGAQCGGDAGSNIACSTDYFLAGNSVRVLETTDNVFLTGTAATAGDSATISFKAASTVTKPDGTYQDTITLTAVANAT
jgi:hypothetical protein